MPSAPSATAAPEPLLLRHASPAAHFNEAAPVGNGRLGAMVFGRTHQERIVLNEDSCWAGGPRDRLNPARHGALAELRALLFAGRHAEAETLAGERLLAVPRFIDSYQPLGELELRIGWRAAVTDYRRWLDLDGAVSVAEWSEGPFRHRRVVFASAPDQVLVVRHEISGGPPAPFAIRLTREGPHTPAALVDGDFLLLGHAQGTAPHPGSNPPPAPGSGLGLAVAARVRVLAEDPAAKITALENRIQISSTSAVTVLVALATAHREADPAAACRATLDAAARHAYADLLARHQAEHRALFRRFSLSLADAPADDGRTVEERLAALRAGAEDPGLFALVTQHRRYLLLAASRPGSLPSNLQGLWTEQLQGPWNSDYHFNINIQLNYLPAETVGLPECVEPLLVWLEKLVPAGERTARELYGCRGWTLHHVSDSHGATEPFDSVRGLWPWGAAWMCLHLHDHWRHSLDPAVLARVWPLLRGAARFVLDFLVEGPAGTAHAGLLTTCPSHSPENAFLTADGKHAEFTYGATMDFGLCRALFAACREQLDAMGATTAPADLALRAEFDAAEQRLPALRVSPTTGGIQEWAEDYPERDPGHRHISPLFDLHPGVGISLRRTPELAAAAANSLRRKVAHQFAGRHPPIGWAFVWFACLWARLGRGDEAHARLRRMLIDASTPNLWTFAHDQPQVADACGSAAAVCEMLVQTHDGAIDLLPALPAEWRRGRVSGLRIPGALALDLEWRDSRVVRARFIASRATTLRLRTGASSGDSIHVIPLAAGASALWTDDLASAPTLTLG